jgi:hypothetical protein
MRRAILILLIAFGFAGCKSQTPTVDPFFGRTTVPPPPTGSITGQAADPYYQRNGGAIGLKSPSPSSSIAPVWTNPNNAPQYSNNTPQYPNQGSSIFSSAPSTTAPGIAASPLQPAPQNSPTLSPPPAGYTPQMPAAQPASMPSSTPNSTWPSGNRYTPPGNNFNYQGTPTGVPNVRPVSNSPNRISAPYFAGGVPNRRTIPVVDGSPQPVDSSGGMNGANPGTNYTYPASGQYSQPTPAQNPNNSQQPSWRESTSSDTRFIDDNVEAAANTETIEEN